MSGKEWLRRREGGRCVETERTRDRQDKKGEKAKVKRILWNV